MSPGYSRTGVLPYRRFVAVGIGFLVLAAAAVILWRVRDGSRAERPVGPDDPNSLRLLYVRSDCGEQVYDDRGDTLGKRPVGTTHAYWWKPNELKREFVFACRIDGDDTLFPRLVSFHLNGWLARQDHAFLEVRDANDSWVTVSCHAKLPCAMMSGGFRWGPIRLLRPRREPVRTVDAHITYHAGPRGPARATFVGPFRLGQQVRSQEDSNIVMNVKNNAASETCFVFSGPPPMEHGAPVLAYAEGGRRHFLSRGRTSTSSSRGFSWEYRCRTLALESITHITLDETPTTQVYRGIKVSYPKSPVRTYPAFLDEMAERLDLDVDLGTEVAVSAFVQKRDLVATPSQALRILDISQENFLYRATETLLRAAPADLTASERKQLADILSTWLDSDREISACLLGTWAGWEAYADRTISVLMSRDLERGVFAQLVRTLRTYPEPTAEQLTSITNLVLDRGVIHQYMRDKLVEYVLEHAGSQTQLLRRMAECDKPWIWRRIIRPDARFRRFIETVPPSRIVQLRAVAMGMHSWIDNAEALKPQACELLAEVLTPEFVQKSYEDFDWMFEAFVRNTSPEHGTEVVVRYLRRQLAEWDTWQTKGSVGRSNRRGVRKAVQQLNRWHNLNLGGLGSDFHPYGADARYDWKEIAASAVHWSATGEDQSRMPPRWRMSDRDLRVVWHNLDEPERSVIGLWPNGQDPNLSQPHAVMEAGEDFLHYTVRVDESSPGSAASNDFLIRAGVNHRRCINREFTFARGDLPKAFDPGPTNMFMAPVDGVRREIPLWQGNWRIWIELSSARTSVLDGTELFSAWKAHYLADEPATPPLKRVFHKGELNAPGSSPNNQETDNDQTS